MKTCSVPQCERKHRAKGYCTKHYQQIKKHGEILKINEICSVEYCDNKYHAKGYCKKHYKQFKKHGEIKETIFANGCIVEGCKNKHNAKGYCTKHYNQIKNYGKILDITIKDRNEIILKEDYAEIILRNIKHEEVARAIIDLEDVELVKKIKWGLDGKGYARSNLINTSLHRFLLNLNNEEHVDHINRNRLDNRRINLRLCSHQENMFNMSLRKDNTSGVTGVKWRKDTEMWVTVIDYNKKRIHIGSYIDKNEAIKDRLLAEIKYFGKFAPQKHLFEQYGINNY